MSEDAVKAGQQNASVGAEEDGQLPKRPVVHSFRYSDRPAALIGWSVLTILICLLAGEGFARPLNHDEEQFVASGAVLLRQGLFPYLDYPYFHLPNLVGIYCCLFRTNDYLLLTARAFNLACAGALLITLFAFTGDTVKFAGPKR